MAHLAAMNRVPPSSIGHRTGPYAAVWQGQVAASLTRGIALIGESQLAPQKRLRKARQTTKVAAALLRLAPPGLKRKARSIDLALKGVRRMLAEGRDADARAEAFLRLAPALALPRRDRTRLERAMTRPMQPARHVHAADLEEVARRFSAMVAQVEGWVLPRGAGPALLRAIVSDYRRLRRDVRQALADRDIEALHALRKRVIRHRHHLALVAAMSGEGSRARWLKREARAKALGVALGRHRDDAMLDEALRSEQDASLYKAAEAALSVLVRQQDDRLGEARHLARRATRRGGKRLARLIHKAINGPARP